MNVLNEMTKAELIWWIEQQFFRSLPRRSEFLLHRWEVKSQELAEREYKNIDVGKALDLKERDKLAKQFNVAKDPAERLKILEKMEPYQRALDNYLKESKAIQGAYKKLDKMYAQIDAERAKERVKPA